MKFYPNILLIAGTGKNVGKTTLGCKIISQNADNKIIGVKFSPHFHSMSENRFYIEKNDRYHISEEGEFSNKDSSRLLQAGAKKVYYIQGRDDYLFAAFEKVFALNNANTLFLVESGGLAGYIKPGLFIVVKNKHKPIKPDNKISSADVFVNEQTDFTQFAKKIFADNGIWIYKDSP